MLSVFGEEAFAKTPTLFLKNLVEISAVFALKSGTLVLALCDGHVDQMISLDECARGKRAEQVQVPMARTQWIFC
jgi:hypothetical protein